MGKKNYIGRANQPLKYISIYHCSMLTRCVAGKKLTKSWRSYRGRKWSPKKNAEEGELRLQMLRSCAYNRSFTKMVFYEDTMLFRSEFQNANWQRHCGDVSIYWHENRTTLHPPPSSLWKIKTFSLEDDKVMSFDAATLIASIDLDLAKYTTKEFLRELPRRTNSNTENLRMMDLCPYTCFKITNEGREQIKRTPLNLLT